jgi:hypothetical protein
VRILEWHDERATDGVPFLNADNGAHFSGLSQAQFLQRMANRRRDTANREVRI